MDALYEKLRFGLESINGLLIAFLLLATWSMLSSLGVLGVFVCFTQSQQTVIDLFGVGVFILGYANAQSRRIEKFFQFGMIMLAIYALVDALCSH